MVYSFQNNKGMTLIEMLIVVTTISILFASFFYFWNTMDIFRKSRDSKRINDLQLLDTALKTLLSTEKNINLGEENIIYTSLPDSSSTCGNYNLLPLFPPYSYRCQTSDNYLKVDGNGWIPVNFTLGKILTISVLPIDPLNNKDYFYAYQVRYGRYKLTARFESQTNISKMVNDGGFEPTLYEVGSDLFIPSPHSGLVSYWSFDEGTGTIAYDLSGYGNNGTLYNFTGTSGWTIGKIGKALNFDGADDYIEVTNVKGLSSGNMVHTISAWIKVNRLPINRAWILLLGQAGAGSHHWLINSTGGTQFGVWNGGQLSPVLPIGEWIHIVITFDGTTLKGYTNGFLFDKTSATFNFTSLPLTLAKAYLGENYFNGLIDELRIYNRALSDSEIKAIYESTK
jgi:prepilin-type N-terminal cleavage/methylation domain-containing protein